MLGMRSITSPMAASASASAVSSAACRSLSSAWRAISAAASSPRCFASAIALAAAFRSARAASTRARSSSRRVVGLEELVDVPHGLLAAAGERRLRALRIGADLPDVQHQGRESTNASRKPATPSSSTLGTVQPAIGFRAASASATATPRPAASRSSTSFAPSPNATTAAGSIPSRSAYELERRALAHAGQGELEEDRERLGDEGPAVEVSAQLVLEPVERLRLADDDDLGRRPVEPLEQVADRVRLEPGMARVGDRLLVQLLDVEAGRRRRRSCGTRRGRRPRSPRARAARPSAGEAATRRCAGRRRARPGSR